MVVMADHGIGGHIDGKNMPLKMRQRLGALGNPAPAVLQALAAVMIVPVQKSAAHTVREQREMQ